jgi:hypothetical protein
MKHSEHDSFAEHKFRSFVFQVLALNLFLWSGIIGVVGIFVSTPSLSIVSPWSLLFIPPVLLALYGCNEFFKAMKLVLGGWYLCHDCRRPKAKKTRCTRMKAGLVVEVCKSCLNHFEVPSPLHSKVSPRRPLWSRGDLILPSGKTSVEKPPVLRL